MLEPLNSVLDTADHRLRTGSHRALIWPTGFGLLDRVLHGGFRAGELVLLGGPHGVGKTTWALQVARHTATCGRPVVFVSYEHDHQTLLVRLLALEAGEIGGPEAPGAERIRATLEGSDGRRGAVTLRLSDTGSGSDAVARLHEYGDRLLLHRASGAATDLPTIGAAVAQAVQATGQQPLVVVDYLQKVPVPQAPTEYERVTTVAEGLKDLALELGVPVLAVAAADKDGLAAGRRLRVADLRGSTALAYEADTVLLLHDKYDVVARHHLVYSLGNADTFRDWVVLSVEKYRNGPAGADLELRKRFDQCRFETQARRVAERLVDERVFVD